MLILYPTGEVEFISATDVVFPVEFDCWSCLTISRSDLFSSVKDFIMVRDSGVDFVGGTEGVGVAQVIAYSTSRITADFRKAPRVHVQEI